MRHRPFPSPPPRLHILRRLFDLVRRLTPQSLRARMLLLTLLVVAVPILLAGYMLELKGRDALIAEKQAKLFGLARLLDSQLGDGFDSLLAGYDGPTEDRKAQIAFLNRKLAPITDAVADANPGVGVGYYCLLLNAIVTYGPSDQYGGTVGITIPPNHPGWKVMSSGEAMVETGPQVRGQIMNAMWPIKRDGQVIGYIWSNELSDSVDRQAEAMKDTVDLIIALGLLFGLALTLTMSVRLSRDISSIKHGLAALGEDLSRPIPAPPGEIGEIAFAINDLAHALSTARTLRENILNSIADGVISVDRQGLVIAINPAACQMVGITAQDIIGKPYQTLFDPKAEFSSQLLDTLHDGGDHIGVPVVYPLRDRILHVNASTSLLRDGRGLPIGAVVVFKDQSERVHLQEQIMRADRLAALGELVAGVAHEVRNPLTSIRGFMQYLQTYDDPAEWREYGPLIMRQVDGLNRIVSELLEFGRPRPPRIGPVQINEVIADVARLATGKSSIRIDQHLSPDLPTIEADGEALKQVLLNLLINAAQAIGEQGEITVDSWREDGQVVIRVADTGCGIAPEHLGKVFDPFFSTKPSGTGLGLAMAHRIIDAHHGVISIDSSPDHGTVVTLRLPLTHKDDPA